jgi:3-dehydroquinate dehydratase
MNKSAVAMEMLSGRIPADLYAWFASLEVEGAVTSSDKLRVLLAQLRRQHEGTMDYVSAMAWFRDLMARTRQDLATIDRDSGAQSEVAASLIEQACALAATALSSHPQSKREAQSMEEQLVRRALAMSEGLLRQAVTPTAAAYDPKVVRRHIGAVADLARLVSTSSNPAEGGDPHG